MSLQINKEIIDDSLIEEELEYITRQYSSQKNTTIPSKEDLLILVKENIVRRVLLNQEVEKLNIKIERNNVLKEVENIKRLQYYSQPLSAKEEEELFNYTESRLKINVLLKQICQDIEKPSEEYLKTFYQDNKDLYHKKREILIVDQILKPYNQSNKVLQYNEIKSQRNIFCNTFKNSKDKLLDKWKEDIIIKNQTIFKNDFDITITNILFNLAIFDTSDIIEIHEENSSMFCFFYIRNKKIEEPLSFEEIQEIIYKDLMKELEERKIDIFIYKLMQKSKIIDNKWI